MYIELSVRKSPSWLRAVQIGLGIALLIVGIQVVVAGVSGRRTSIIGKADLP